MQPVWANSLSRDPDLWTAFPPTIAVTLFKLYYYFFHSKKSRPVFLISKQTHFHFFDSSSIKYTSAGLHIVKRGIPVFQHLNPSRGQDLPVKNLKSNRSKTLFVQDSWDYAEPERGVSFHWKNSHGNGSHVNPVQEVIFNNRNLTDSVSRDGDKFAQNPEYTFKCFHAIATRLFPPNHFCQYDGEDGRGGGGNCLFYSSFQARFGRLQRFSL